MIRGPFFVQMSNPIGKCKVGYENIHGFSKNVIFPDDESIDGNFGDLMSILNLYVAVSGSIFSQWNILDPPLSNSILYISPNWPGGGILTICQV